ncbi:MAG: hypothetical protein RR470_13190 [Vagococcus sp.]|uniref:hypothetical protein n=1 Tax=Vagococcus sp. TaxID=1933889 RepID=UPI002FC9CD20
MKLIKLEIKKINLMPYLLTALVMPFVSLIFMYFMAFIPKIDTSNASAIEFSSHSFIYTLGLMINIAGFVCLGTTLIGKLVISAYDDKNCYLTLSYPVARKKVLRAKLQTGLLVSSVGIILSGIFSSLLFFISESIFQIVDEPVLFNDVVNFTPLIIVAVFLVVSIITISLSIGWWKNSIPLTIVSGILIYSVSSNLLSAGLPLLLIFTCFLSLITFITLFFLVKKVNGLEV